MPDYSHCKNIIFDFGGVLLDIDYAKTEDAFRNLLVDRSHGGFSQASQSELFDQIEVGAISAEEFRDGLRALFQRQDLPDATLDSAWNALLGLVRLPDLAYVKDISQAKRTFLLSNTNEIHLSCVQSVICQQLGSIAAFESAFERVYYSHLLGLRKPHLEIFRLVLEENDLDPAETLFIDDSIQHIEAATHLGLSTHHLDGSILDLKL